MTHTAQRDWEFFRGAAREMLWPKIDPEYQAELRGIADGLEARKVKLDLYDVVAMNAFEELPFYYVPWLNEQARMQNAPKIDSPENSSAFVATGSWTKNHQIVMAHNNWTSYVNGERWRIIFDILPQKGYRILMDGFPGVIASGDDFGITVIADHHDYDVVVDRARVLKSLARANEFGFAVGVPTVKVRDGSLGNHQAVGIADTPMTGCSAIARPARSPGSSWG